MKLYSVRILLDEILSQEKQFTVAEFNQKRQENCRTFSHNLQETI